MRLYMNYVMMASPNYAYRIYDANNKNYPNGSGELKNHYIDWYKLQDLNYTLVPMDGRSDYVGVVDEGILTGGISAGSDQDKTENGQELFRGEAGKPLDPCYHQRCDNLSNLDYIAQFINTKLIAHSVATYAESLDHFPV